jgi:hypothetical protein
MANKKFLWGMFSVALAFSLAVTSCSEDDDPPPPAAPTFPAAKGKITITGLDNFNGKYVYATGAVGENIDNMKALVGLTDITGYDTTDVGYKLVKISEGKAEVPLYYPNPKVTGYADSYLAYDGSDIVTAFSLYIFESTDGVLKATDTTTLINATTKSLTSGEFKGGSLTVKWDELN